MITQPAPPPLAARLRWPLLLLASAALHAAVLGGWRPAPASTPALGGEHSAPLTVTLVSLAGRRAEKPHAIAKAAPRPEHRPQHRITPHPAVHPTVAAAQPQPTPPAAPATATAQTVGGTDHGAALKQQVAGRVRGALARYFRYPPRARREGWQGAVLLRFRINSDGTLAAIQVAHSSGHALLDRAAVGALSRVGRLSLESALPHPLELQLPVIYRLEES